MASNVISYFATLGRKSRQQQEFIYKNFHTASDQDRKGCPPSEIWNSAITDITIINNQEELDLNDKLVEKWEVLSVSLEDQDLPFPHLAVKRRDVTHRLDHIKRLEQEIDASTRT